MRKRIMIVSPHPDDACFSLGGGILRLNYNSILVWDIFSIQKYSITKDMMEKAESIILDEEKLAMADFGVEYKLEGLPEAGLRGYKRLGEILNSPWPIWHYYPSEKDIFTKLVDAFNRAAEELSPHWVALPLGCGSHVDHILVREAGFEWWSRLNAGQRPRLAVYEDLPYGMNGEWVEHALSQCFLHGYHLRERLVNVKGHIDKKAEIMSIYRSQIRQRDISAIAAHARKFKTNGENERIWIVNEARRDED